MASPLLLVNCMFRKCQIALCEYESNCLLRCDYSQLVKLVDLYGVVDVFDCLLPLTLTLLSDKVAQVRVVCFRVVSKICHLYLVQ